MIVSKCYFDVFSSTLKTRLQCASYFMPTTIKSIIAWVAGGLFATALL